MVPLRRQKGLIDEFILREINVSDDASCSIVKKLLKQFPMVLPKERLY